MLDYISLLCITILNFVFNSKYFYLKSQIVFTLEYQADLIRCKISVLDTKQKLNLYCNQESNPVFYKCKN